LIKASRTNRVAGESSIAEPDAQTKKRHFKIKWRFFIREK
jgi:hypothetical protein